MASQPAYAAPLPSPVDRFEDETDTSSLSDYDSEWTQVSGNEDDSDFPPLTGGSDRSLSRAGTIDGSVDGDVWEGMAEELLDPQGQAITVHEETRLDDVDATNADAAYNAQSQSALPTDQDDLINNALNCSVMGTLTASRARSAASSLHASMTESQSKLRLSFPDPLFRSNEDFGRESPPQSFPSSPTSALDENCENPAIDEASSSFADVEAPATLDVSELNEADAKIVDIQPDNSPCILSLVLYGSASSPKWHIAERIMKLALQHDMLSAPSIENETVRHYIFDHTGNQGMVSGVHNTRFRIKVVDRTSNISGFESIDRDHELTLAIVLLPSRLPSVMPKHDYYLPLICPPSLNFGTTVPIISSAFSKQVMSDSAKYAWDRLDVCKDRLLVLDAKRHDAILDVSELETLDRSVLVKTFSKLFRFGDGDSRVRNLEVVRLFNNRWCMVAFVAATLFAITIGSRVNPSRSVTDQSMAGNDSNKPLFVPAVNETPVHEVSSISSNGAAFSLSLREYALAVFQTSSHAVATTSAKLPTQTSLTSSSLPTRVTSLPVSQEASHSKDLDQPSPSTASSVASTSKCSCHSKPTSWTDRLNLGLRVPSHNGLMARPASSVLAFEKDIHLSRTGGNERGRKAPYISSVGLGLGKKAAKELDKALSTRAVQNSLALVSGMGKALAEVVGQDLKALYDAIDELLRALSHQIEATKSSVAIAKVQVRCEFYHRNALAKQNAKKIRAVGERFFKAAGERLRTGTEEAAKMIGHAQESVKKVKDKAGKSRQARRIRREEERERKSGAAQSKKSRVGKDSIGKPATSASEKKQARAQERIPRRERRERNRKSRLGVGREQEQAQGKQAESEGIFQAVMGAVF